MKNKSTKRAVVLSDFGGIDQRLPVGPGAAAESVNFRIMPDGSLKKRNGFKKRLTLPVAPSCLASVCRAGEKRLIAVAGTKLYSLDLEAGSSTALPGALPYEAAESSLISFRDKLFVLDGRALRLVGDLAISLPGGYAPLYGREWHPINGGEVYEPFNILTKNFRIMYRGITGYNNITLPKNVGSVVRAEVDGVQLGSGNYSFNSSSGIVTSTYFGKADAKIVLWCTLKTDHAELSKLNACLMAAVAGSGSRAVMFCSRTPTAPHIVYRSTPVSDGSLAEAKRGFAVSTEFYFPESGMFSVGSDDLPVRAILPLDDRVIVYNDDEAWLVSSAAERPDPILLCASAGCSSPDAAVICGELPVSLCGNSVYYWAPDLEAYNELSAVCISAPIAPLIDDELARRGKLITDRENRELWLYDPESAERPILVYDRDAEHWYRFDGFSPELAFYHGGRIGFCTGKDVFLFLPDADCDSPDGSANVPIASEFSGGWLDLGEFETQKSAARAAVRHEGPLDLTVEYDNGSSETLSFDGSPSASAPAVEHIRLRRERFHQVRFSLSSGGPGSGRVYDIALYAEADDGVCET